MHVSINLLSVFSAEAYNQASHFMGTNPVIQYVMQPILIIGVVFHFVMGFILEARNRSARPIKYAIKDKNNATWASQTMIYSGLVILAFLALHFVDFWFPEMNYKYIQQSPEVADRYYEELVHKFQNPARVGFYVLSFILLALHLHHGFQSSFQSVGFDNKKYMPAVKVITRAFSILVPAAFILIAIYHFFNH